LLLTMLCLAFDELMDFPKNRAELYKEALDALLKKWDSSRGIEREDIYRYLSLKRKEGMLSYISAATFPKGEYFLPQHVLEKYIASYIQNLSDRNLPEMEDKTLDPDSTIILKAIEAHHGLFVERARGIYSFSHLTFQEYFTALYLVSTRSGTLKSIIEEYFPDNKWREVFLLATGMLMDADEFLEMMQHQLYEFIDASVHLCLSNVMKGIGRLMNISESTPYMRTLLFYSALDLLEE